MRTLNEIRAERKTERDMFRPGLTSNRKEYTMAIVDWDAYETMIEGVQDLEDYHIAYSCIHGRNLLTLDGKRNMTRLLQDLHPELARQYNHQPKGA